MISDKFYKKYQATQAMALLSRMESCFKGEHVEYVMRGVASRDAEIRVPLASDARFLPMMNDFLSPSTFISEVVAYQVANDIADPENVIGQIANLYYRRMVQIHANDLKAVVALYDFFKQGRCDEKATKRKGLYNENHQCLSLWDDYWYDKYARQVSRNTGSPFFAHRRRVAEGSPAYSQYTPVASRAVTLAASER